MIILIPDQCLSFYHVKRVSEIKLLFSFYIYNFEQIRTANNGRYGNFYFGDKCQVHNDGILLADKDQGLYSLTMISKII